MGGACIVFDPILVSRVCKCPILDKFETWSNKMVVISHFCSSGFVWEWGNCLPKSIIRSFLNQKDPSIVWASHSWTNRCCVIWIWWCPDSLTCSFPPSILASGKHGSQRSFVILCSWNITCKETGKQELKAKRKRFVVSSFAHFPTHFVPELVQERFTYTHGFLTNKIALNSNQWCALW